jgi:hypothetical protein
MLKKSQTHKIFLSQTNFSKLECSPLQKNVSEPEAYLIERPEKGTPLALPSYIRLDLKALTLTSILVYDARASITTEKGY